MTPLAAYPDPIFDVETLARQVAGAMERQAQDREARDRAAAELAAALQEAARPAREALLAELSGGN